MLMHKKPCSDIISRPNFLVSEIPQLLIKAVCFLADRLDDVIIFKRITQSNMPRIVDIQLKGVRKLLEDRKISLQITPQAKAWLATKGYGKYRCDVMVKS